MCVCPSICLVSTYSPSGPLAPLHYPECFAAVQDFYRYETRQAADSTNAAQGAISLSRTHTQTHGHPDYYPIMYLVLESTCPPSVSPSSSAPLPSHPLLSLPLSLLFILHFLFQSLSRSSFSVCVSLSLSYTHTRTHIQTVGMSFQTRWCVAQVWLSAWLPGCCSRHQGAAQSRSLAELQTGTAVQ